MTPNTGGSVSRVLTDDVILSVVLQAMRTTNLSRTAESQLSVAPDAAIFGPTSPLDSLGLLTLLLDIEEDLQAAGAVVRLSDDRAMSQTRSPFRSVESLVDYIGRIARDS
jgi:D-alanine--poly(phosphoribitol) ligase subunit 2